MILTLTHRIEVPSIQKATALRDKLGEYLEEDGDVTVINSMVGKETKTVRVKGIDTKTKQQFEEEVEVDPELTDQEIQESESEGTRVVAHVEPVPV